MSDAATVVRISEAEGAGLVAATLNSFAFDFVARSAMGGTNLSYFVLQQLPFPPPEAFLEKADTSVTYAELIAPRALELIYTAWDLEPFANDFGSSLPPFKWNESRRFLLRCELDATFFHLYGIERDDVDYMMDTFPIVRRHDEEQHGEYRTKRVILEIYDEMATAIKSGKPYKTRLEPPPADPSLCHPESTRPEWATRTSQSQPTAAVEAKRRGA